MKHLQVPETKPNNKNTKSHLINHFIMYIYIVLFLNCKHVRLSPV